MNLSASARSVPREARGNCGDCHGSRAERFVSGPREIRRIGAAGKRDEHRIERAQRLEASAAPSRARRAWSKTIRDWRQLWQRRSCRSSVRCPQKRKRALVHSKIIARNALLKIQQHVHRGGLRILLQKMSHVFVMHGQADERLLDAADPEIPDTPIRRTPRHPAPSSRRECAARLPWKAR